MQAYTHNSVVGACLARVLEQPGSLLGGDQGPRKAGPYDSTLTFHRACTTFIIILLQ
jgi:hypothetical protein